MAVRVEIEPPGMRMQNGGHAQFGTQTFRIEAELFQGGDGHGQQHTVHHPLMAR